MKGWPRRTIVLGILALMCMTFVLAQTPAPAPSPTAPAPVVTGDSKGGLMSAWDLFAAGGPIGLLLVVASITATALVVEHFLTIRRDRILPEELITQLHKLIEAEEYEKARRLAAQHGSLLGNVVNAGLGQIGGMFGWFDIQTAMQEAAEGEVSRLYRKLEYLTFIAAAAPMLGLLGTVTGMIISFNTISGSEGGAKMSELAGGIAQALVTTCEGLVLAIPVMFFVGFFRNRIDSLMAEAGSICEKLMMRFRRGQA